jgi:hypothetical protein
MKKNDNPTLLYYHRFTERKIRMPLCKDPLSQYFHLSLSELLEDPPTFLYCNIFLRIDFSLSD